MAKKKTAKTKAKAAKPKAKKAGETTPKKSPNLKPAWKPGQSGNPLGRPPGSRNKLCATFIEDLHSVWVKTIEGNEGKTVGMQALEDIAKDRPQAFVAAVGNLVPKEFDLGDKTAAGFRQFLEAVQTGQFKARAFDPHEDDDI